MKKASKVFIIISMVLFFYLIFPIIIGDTALKKLDTIKKKDDLMIYSLLVLFFCSFFAGILMLLMDESELNNEGQNLAKSKSTIEIESFSEKITLLKKLLDDGIITKEEFEEKKAIYINEMN